MAEDEAVKKKFDDALKGVSVNVKGILTDPDMTLTEAGIKQIWNALKLADVKVSL